MRNRLLAIGLAIMCIVSAKASDINGWWAGDVMGLKVVFHLDDGDGTWKASVSSPMQGAVEIPCGAMTVNGDSIAIAMPALNASFAGVFKAGKEEISGTFRQGLELPLTLSRTTAEAVKIERPQDPKPPFPYISEDVAFGHEGATLAGTLTRPMFATRPGAVVLISGSGAQNRDEEILGHRPFAVIADWLTRAGWAVLRYDDRGVGGSSKGTPHDTTHDFALDASSAIDYLKTRPDIDPDRIGLLGHSEGGTIAMLLAAGRPDDVAFIVTLGGMAVNGADLMVKQNEMIMELGGTEITPDIHDQLVDAFHAIQTETDSAVMAERLKPSLTRLNPHSSPELIARSVRIMTSPWYVAFVRLDPSAALDSVSCPMLALNGGWDSQVNADQNLEAVKTHVPHAVVKKYPRMNHMMQEPPTYQQSMAYGAITQTVSPQVLEDIAAFLTDISRRSR